MARSFHNIIFDMDGTLIDSKPGIHSSLRHAIRRLGHQLPETIGLDWVLGPPLEQVMTRLLSELGDARVAEGVSYYREHYGEAGLFDASPFAGIPETLAKLAGSGMILIVGTSKYTSFARRILDHFKMAQFFQAIYGTEPDAHVPSKSELFRQIVTDRRLETSDTVVVGDREFDIIGARANSLNAIGVLYGYGTREELVAAGANSLCDTPGALCELI